ncbi:hypothetical protein AAG570_012334 [Ranatra chinensis]|uniref:Uncharacterized protein n=1 Tax=Ranatra chinensis TaxID=642074 RepID=A0ABD0YUU0_9HEMI
MEANRKLQQVSGCIDQTLLQAQVDTLQWQLKQAESNRQMYRAVMEQVSKFLERVHKTLESSTPTKGQTARSKARVARSRSVHAVAQSRASSPSASVHRANSISQIQDGYSTFRDFACRGSRSLTVDEVAPERLSQEAFRLLRTIQSLLGTREPDLARVSSSDNETVERRMGSCSSLLQSSSSREPEEPSSSPKVGGPATPQLSVGSAEDESGFSSMSSFHEVGLPGNSTNNSSDVGTSGSFHELGLPVVDSPSGGHRHRRWSSTPVDRHSTGYQQRDALRVLWV